VVGLALVLGEGEESSGPRDAGRKWWRAGSRVLAGWEQRRTVSLPGSSPQPGSSTVTACSPASCNSAALI